VDGNFFDETGQLGPHTNAVLDLAQKLSEKYQDHFVIKGPGIGDRETNRFINGLRVEVHAKFDDEDKKQAVYSEFRLFNTMNSIRVDYWFPDEGTILEIAFGLRNPLSEFERDVLKAVTARDAGLPVSKLVLLSKPGALKRLGAPWYQHVIRWAKKKGVSMYIFELNKLDKTNTCIQ
jgi:hypothetical protein